MKKEYFKIIIDFDDYLIGDCGTVISLKKNGWKKMKTIKNDNDDYLRVNLYMNGKQHRWLIHRLVAEAFIPNPDNLPQVNHKNEIKTDNRAENLEWCDYTYNINYGLRNQRASESLKKSELFIKYVESLKKNIVQIFKDEVIKIYQSITSVKKDGFNSGHVCLCCQGKLKSHKGFNWMYLSDYEKIHGHIE